MFDNRDSVENIPNIPAPGVYAIFAKDRTCLPNICLPSNGLAYIGKSNDLEQRNHFKAKHSGFHTLRRSIGAILKVELALTAMPRSSGQSDTNYKNYRFSDEGELRLTNWMLSNLEYSIHPFDGDVGQLEEELILELEPALNLTIWSNPQKKTIQALRNACKAEAKLIWQNN